MPESWIQAVLILTLVVPGFTYQVSRQGVAGPDPEHREFSARMLHAITSTAVFACIYLVAFGPQITVYIREPDRALDNAQFLSMAFVVLALIVPWSVARLLYWLASSEWFKSRAGRFLDRLHLRRPYDPTPSAWDFIFGQGRPGWVRVQLEDGRWRGGFFGSNSFASSFPNPQEIFVEQGWVINEDGTFTDVLHAADGMIIKCENCLTVDFIPLELDAEVQTNNNDEQEEN